MQSKHSPEYNYAYSTAMTKAEHQSVSWISQNIPHHSPSRATYGISILSILEKTDRGLTAPQSNLSLMDTPYISVLTGRRKSVVSRIDTYVVEGKIPTLSLWNPVSVLWNDTRKHMIMVWLWYIYIFIQTIPQVHFRIPAPSSKREWNQNTWCAWM